MLFYSLLGAGRRRADADSCQDLTALIGGGDGPVYAASDMVASRGFGPGTAEPASVSLEQAQKLLASVKWCPRLDSDNASSVRGILRDAIDLAGLRRQADGVAPPSPAHIQQMLGLPDDSTAWDIALQLHRWLLREFWQGNTRLYYLLRPVIALRGLHAAADAREIQRLTVVGQDRCGYSLLKWMLSFDEKPPRGKTQGLLTEAASRLAEIRRLAGLSISASATFQQFEQHVSDMHTP